MKRSEFSLSLPGIVLKGTAWVPEAARCSLLIEHGMAEHHHRYDDFAEFLSRQGIAVYAYDKRGHGLTAGVSGSVDFSVNAGWLAAKDGWRVMVDDSLAVVDWILGGGSTGSKDMPLILFGHSMGSFGLRSLLADPRLQQNRIAGAILSGTAGPVGLMGFIGIALTNIMVGILGPKRPSPFLNNLFIGPYAALACGKQTLRTPVDWISSDSNQVDRYIADPYCGGVMRTSFYRDMITGLTSLFGARHRRQFPLNIPILLVSGERDPVSKLCRGVFQLQASYQKWGVQDVQVQIIKGSHHETLHDTRVGEVNVLISEWIFSHLPG